MQETVESLTSTRDEAVRELGNVEGLIAQARLEADDRKLGRLRGRRERALRDIDEASSAIALANEVEAAERAAAQAEAAAARDRRVREIAAERLHAAAGVDEALIALEAAVSRYQALGRELGSLTGSWSAIARKESQNLRWGIWASAERTAGLLCVPYANGHRRRTLAQMEGAKMSAARAEGEEQ
ncbi:MAG: hypothetical protein AAF563_04705 [Pseudomonadota bacterium]